MDANLNRVTLHSAKDWVPSIYTLKVCGLIDSAWEIRAMIVERNTYTPLVVALDHRSVIIN